MKTRESLSLEQRIELMAERVELGLDIWTGETLEGLDADNWVRIQDETPELMPELTKEETEELREILNWMGYLIT